MTLAEVFKTNCRATASLCKEKPGLAFSDLTSGLGGKNKNGIIARFSFDEFFIDLYFIENGPLAYAPNTIWLSVGFESCSFLPFSIYDILAFSEPENFKCYTYPYLYTQDVMIQSFGEINDLFKAFIPLMHDISGNGVKKNKLIAGQKEAINKFVGDDIFQKEIEMLDASVKIREMLIRNYVEGVISHSVLGGVSDFYSGNKERAIKKLTNAKHKTVYEENLLNALSSGRLDDFDPSPFRDANYKNYTSIAKKRTYSLGAGGVLKFLLPVVIATPVFTLILIFIYLFLCAIMFRDASFYMNCDLFSVIALFSSGFLIANLLSFHFSHRIINFFKRKKSKKHEVIEVKRQSKILKFFSIFTETVVIVLLFSAVNNSIAFYENKVTFPQETTISLRQSSIKYEYLEAVYKVKGFYFNNKFIESEHYLIVAKNGTKIDTVYSLNSDIKAFEKEVLPTLLENGCEYKEIKSEEEIK
ncbi:MAG: hypothetical protein E7557_02475 [Ruminococcaceae bacterium]|nr:hypothetical protein [Oscillospiraceae bacterium]